MKVNKNISITPVFISAVLMFCSYASAACDYHDQSSFGMHMNGFGQTHPLMQRHILNSRTPSLTIEHERKVVAELNQTQSIEITYVLPVEFKNVNLLFTHSDGIKLDVGENNNVIINDTNGTYKLDYVATTKGSQHIRVWINAMKDSLPYSKVQRIDVSGL